MPPLVAGGKFPVFIMAPVLMFSWQEKYPNHLKSQENLIYFKLVHVVKRTFQFLQQPKSS